MKRSMRCWIGLVAVVTGMLLVASPVAAQVDAPGGCDVEIIDTTTNHVLNTTAVKEAIDRLEKTGADVRVRAFQEAPVALETYQASQVQQCATWKGPDGFTKGNLVTVIFSMDRKSAIYYGANFHDELDDAVDGIRNDAMGDRFRAGDFTAGVVDSLDAITDEITPTNWGAIWKWVGIVLGTLVALVLLVLGLRYGARRYNRYQAAQRKRAETQATAQRLRSDVADAYESIDHDMTALQPEYTLALGIIEGKGEEGLECLKSSVDAMFEALTNDWLDANNNPNSDPSKSRNQVGYDANVATWRALQELASRLQEDLKTLGDQCRRAKTKSEEVPAELARQRQLVQELADIQMRFVMDGYHPVGQIFVEQVPGRFDQAQSLIDTRQYDEAMAILAGIDAERKEVVATIANIPKLQAKLSDRLSAVVSEASLFSGYQAEANEALDRARSSYQRSNWTELEVLFERAKAAIAGWRSTHVTAKLAISMEFQDWTAAATHVAELENTAATIKRDFKQVVAGVGQLEEIAASAARSYDELASQVTSTRRRVNGYKGEQSGAKGDLTRLEGQLPSLVNLLEDTRPNYVGFKSKLDEMTSAVKSVASSAKRRHDAVEAEEARVAREAEEAAARRRREDDEAARRSSSSSSYGGGYYGGSSGSSGSSSGGDSGGSSSGSYGGDSGGGSSGSW